METILKQASAAGGNGDDSRHGSPTQPSNKYDPQYDPLVAPDPGRGREYAPTYWAATAGPAPDDDGPITHDIDVDVAIIGAGFTGLVTALELAREYGIKATVLEANRVSWGCTSRNGGQAQNASGRLTRSQWIERWGRETALRMHAEIRDGFDYFKHLIESGNIACDPQPGGHLYIAHRPWAMEKLRAQSKVLNEVFNYKSRILSADEVKRQYVGDAECHGAMHEPDGIGVHPLKLAYGYLRMAREGGATVHPSSPVTHWETRNGIHYLTTPGGVVRARAVGVATGGYTSQGLHRQLRNRIMPILSNSMVTRPLTDAEIAVCNFRTNEVITDTRTLRHYYRKLPDNRVQIGSRSAITGRDAPNQRHQQLLIDGLHRKFPALKGIQIDYSWWGWVDVSHDMMPRIVQPDPNETVYYALGYGGNGVMYSAQAGRRMAQWIAGHGRKLDLPIFTSPLPGHMFAPFRRLGQRMLFHWYHFRDERA
ncbi:FAD-dependent oxidoreductase [Pandoraea thiooxydans]|uniref:FAD-dependent oxidoreductase n=1 Tax=Pandoraea thiooxydans TaxID=445709 RepID=A0A0G3EPC4_9BURK|nr:FAD-binding oxidoreductase [Pandoraea thiooxydans]AKJ68840.1 FAD-dependent oxidoreductase [Pandoraea thiooxydans]APR96321.1 FAD-dependent oxidoreductase [Pandoraea thiooxydans]